MFSPVVTSRVQLRLDRKIVNLGDLRAGEEVVWEDLSEVKRVAMVVGHKRMGVSSPPASIAKALELRIARSFGKTLPHEVLAAVDPDDQKPNQNHRPLDAARTGTCDPRGPAWRRSGVSRDEAPVALSEPNRCSKKESPPPAIGRKTSQQGIGMPSSPLLTMLRQRIIPVARGCFRRDRAGRLDYQKRAMFVFRLADREVVAADVKGKISKRLHSCLLSAMDTLDVPYFSGNVIVRYPLITEAEALPHEIELTPEVACQVDSVLSKDTTCSP